MYKVMIDYSLPRNSWLVDTKQQHVVIGSNVERIENSGFFEGGWAHTISPFSDSESCLRLGSGFQIINGKRLKFFTPSHSLESIYTLRFDGNLFISNSLAFVLSRAMNLVQDIDIKLLARPLWRATEGIKSYPREIYKDSFLTVSRFFYCQLDFYEGKVLEKSYSCPYSFQNYTSYKEFLVETIKQVKKNSTSKEIASYLSSGYDSVACTVLAREAGGQMTLSIKKDRKGKSDSGRNIASLLGMQSYEYYRKERKTLDKKFDWGTTTFEYLDDTDLDRYEFFVGINFEEDVLGSDYDIADYVILTGFNGDKLWGMNTSLGSNLERGEVSGSSFYEYRLRVGFTHIPIACLLTEASVDIRKITLSSEMMDYVIDGTNYNRPIARRIAEEAGIPRDAFGISKKAASTMIENLDEYRNVFFSNLMSRYLD